MSKRSLRSYSIIAFFSCLFLMSSYFLTSISIIFLRLISYTLCSFSTILSSISFFLNSSSCRFFNSSYIFFCSRSILFYSYWSLIRSFFSAIWSYNFYSVSSIYSFNFILLISSSRIAYSLMASNWACFSSAFYFCSSISFYFWALISLVFISPSLIFSSIVSLCYLMAISRFAWLSSSFFLI